jgi:hypothetical protein
MTIVCKSERFLRYRTGSMVDVRLCHDQCFGASSQSHFGNLSSVLFQFIASHWNAIGKSSFALLNQKKYIALIH